MITYLWSIELLQLEKNVLNEVYNLIEANCMVVIWIKLVYFESFDTEGCLVLCNRVWIKYRHLNQIHQQSTQSALYYSQLRHFSALKQFSRRLLNTHFSLVGTDCTACSYRMYTNNIISTTPHEEVACN